MKLKLVLATLMMMAVSFQVQARSLGVQRTFDCIAIQGSLVTKIALVYSSTIYNLPSVGIADKASLPLKVTRGQAQTVIGLDQREILNSKLFADSGSSIEVSAAAEEMLQDTASVVVKVKLYEKSSREESTSAFSCKLTIHKDLSSSDLF